MPEGLSHVSSKFQGEDGTFEEKIMHLSSCSNNQT